jgi:hypothetical protein
MVQSVMDDSACFPPEIIEHIALFADIDTRRAMGFPPRRLSRDLIEKMNILIGGRLNCEDDPFEHAWNRSFKFLRIRSGKSYLLTQKFHPNNVYRIVDLWNSYPCFGTEHHEEQLNGWKSEVKPPQMNDMTQCKSLYLHTNRYVGNEEVPAAYLVGQLFKLNPLHPCTDINHTCCSVQYE